MRATYIFRKYLVVPYAFIAQLSFAQEPVPFKTVIQPIVTATKQVIVDRELQKNNERPVAPIPIVAVAGCSGVGKSYLAKQLKAQLEEEGLRVKILRLDDFLKLRGQLRDDERVSSPDAHPNFDGRRAYQVLTSLQQGEKEIIQPVWNCAANGELSISDKVISYEDVDVIIMDGIYALESRVYSLNDFSAVRLFIHAPKEVIYQWMCAREAARKFPRPKEVFDADIAYDFRDYERVILPSMKNAQYILYKKTNDPAACELQRCSSIVQ